jgi:DNA-binding NtrC family response regulator
MNEKPLRLLFVDDEERIVSLLRTIFRQNYEVHIATSGDEALRIISKMHIHVIVSDQRMPGMLGIDLLSRVRTLSPNTMRILLTGYSDLAAIVGSVNEGEVFRYINKPWDHTEIKEIVAQAAEIARSTEFAPVLVPHETVAAQSPGAMAPASLLVIDDNKDVINSISGMFQNVYGVHGASNIAQAIEILEKHDISVIITDTHVNNEDTTQLLRILKAQYPLILAILLTEAQDADTVIKLINQVQIFRYANKPIRRGALQLSVKAAVNQSVIYKSNPALLARLAVQVTLDSPHTQTLKTSIMNGLRALRGRFGFLRE